MGIFGDGMAVTVVVNTPPEPGVVVVEADAAEGPKNGMVEDLELVVWNARCPHFVCLHLLPLTSAIVKGARTEVPHCADKCAWGLRVVLDDVQRHSGGSGDNR